MPDNKNKQDKQMPRKDQDPGNREDKQVGNQNLPDDDSAVTQRNPRLPDEDIGKDEDKDQEENDEDVIERE